MPSPPKSARRFTEAARLAAAEARRAKREGPDTFGLPELFTVKDGNRGFTWELRRFGGLVLQRGSETFPNAATARADGEDALATLLASADLPAFVRDRKG